MKGSTWRKGVGGVRGRREGGKKKIFLSLMFIQTLLKKEKTLENCHILIKNVDLHLSIDVKSFTYYQEKDKRQNSYQASYCI